MFSFLHLAVYFLILAHYYTFFSLNQFHENFREIDFTKKLHYFSYFSPLCAEANVLAFKGLNSPPGSDPPYDKCSRFFRPETSKRYLIKQGRYCCVSLSLPLLSRSTFMIIMGDLSFTVLQNVL